MLDCLPKAIWPSSVSVKQPTDWWLVLCGLRYLSVELRDVSLKLRPQHLELGSIRRRRRGWLTHDRLEPPARLAVAAHMRSLRRAAGLVRPLPLLVACTLIGRHSRNPS